MQRKAAINETLGRGEDLKGRKKDAVTEIQISRHSPFDGRNLVLAAREYTQTESCLYPFYTLDLKQC